VCAEYADAAVEAFAVQAGRGAATGACGEDKVTTVRREEAVEKRAISNPKRNNENP